MSLSGLGRACHPLPCVAVTALCAGYAAAAGLPGARLGLLVGAVGTGQLSVGWHNDWVDRHRDRIAERADKPIPAGLVPARAVAAGGLLAAAAAVGLSLALGWRPGIALLAAVACAWAYNAGLKGSPASVLPYLVAFGLVPAVATALALPGAPPPRWPVVAAAALLGAAAHFANTVPDAAADRRTGVRGLPQRIGPRRSLAASGLLLTAAAGVLLATSLPSVAGAAVAGAAAALGAGCLLGVAGGWRGAGRLAFRLDMAAAGLLVVAVVASGTRLS